jgi:hypothetical protein
MPPKKPSELKKQIEAQQDQPAKEGHERTAEGLSVETPTRADFFSNLEKTSKPPRD